MRVIRLAVIACLAALCMCAEAGAQQPIKEGDLLTGTLRWLPPVIPTTRSSKPIRS
jgi:hypothetical protein